MPAGPGYFALHVKENGFDSIAAEIDESLHVLSGVTYMKVDMSKELPFESSYFNFIVSIEGIEHVENQFLFLRNCARVLKKDGRLFITTPNVSSLENRFFHFITDFHERPFLPIKDGLENLYMEHINLIPFTRLEAFIRFAGFEIEKIDTYRIKKGSMALYPFVYPLAFLQYFIANMKTFKKKADRKRYWEIFKMYLSLEVMCGSHLLVVARKK